MIIVEFSLDHPILREALDRVPAVRVRWERSDPVDDRIRVLLWAEGGDLDAFETALEDDPTVTPPQRIVEVGDRRLYQLELIDEGRETSIYPLMVEEGGVIQELTATHQGWEFRASFPDRASFQRFRRFCEDHEIGMDVHRVYDQRDGSEGSTFGLTEPQLETLVAAVDCGYFEIPRECSLAALGDHLGVSENAASERIRRGTKQLVERTIYPAADSAE